MCNSMMTAFLTPDSTSLCISWQNFSRTFGRDIFRFNDLIIEVNQKVNQCDSFSKYYIIDDNTLSDLNCQFENVYYFKLWKQSMKFMKYALVSSDSLYPSSLARSIVWKLSARCSGVDCLLEFLCVDWDGDISNFRCSTKSLCTLSRLHWISL